MYACIICVRSVNCYVITIEAPLGRVIFNVWVREETRRGGGGGGGGALLLGGACIMTTGKRKDVAANR